MRKYYPIVLIAAGFVFTAIVYGRLPESMPVHWNWRGEVDRYGSRLEGTVLLPVLALAIFLLLRFLPRIDPRREHYEKFASSYDLIVNCVVTTMVVLHVVVLGSALGWPVSVSRVAMALIGLMVIVIGNVLPRARSNWWLGVRTPWTLSSERVWARTHRLAGYLLMATGFGFLIAAALPGPWTFGLAAAAGILATAGSVIYSYIAWRGERREKH